MKDELTIQPETTQAYTPPGKKYFFVTAAFEILAREGTTAERVKAGLQEKLEAAGITSLKSIVVSQ